MEMLLTWDINKFENSVEMDKIQPIKGSLGQRSVFRPFPSRKCDQLPALRTSPGEFTQCHKQMEMPKSYHTCHALCYVVLLAKQHYSVMSHDGETETHTHTWCILPVNLQGWKWLFRPFL